MFSAEAMKEQIYTDYHFEEIAYKEEPCSYLEGRMDAFWELITELDLNTEYGDWVAQKEA